MVTEKNNDFIMDLNNYMDIRSMDNDKKKIITDVGVVRQLIPKKNAALEVFRELKTLNVTGIGIIVSCFLTAIMAAINNIAGAVTAGIFSIFAAWVLIKNKRKMDYFRSQYGIQTEPIIK